MSGSHPEIDKGERLVRPSFEVRALRVLSACGWDSGGPWKVTGLVLNLEDPAKMST